MNGALCSSAKARGRRVSADCSAQTRRAAQRATRRARCSDRGTRACRAAAARAARIALRGGLGVAGHEQRRHGDAELVAQPAHDVDAALAVARGAGRRRRGRDSARCARAPRGARAVAAAGDVRAPRLEQRAHRVDGGRVVVDHRDERAARSPARRAVQCATPAPVRRTPAVAARAAPSRESASRVRRARRLRRDGRARRRAGARSRGPGPCPRARGCVRVVAHLVELLEDARLDAPRGMPMPVSTTSIATSPRAGGAPRSARRRASV